MAFLYMYTVTTVVTHVVTDVFTHNSYTCMYIIYMYIHEAHT